MSTTIQCVGFLFAFQCQIPDLPQTTTVVCPPVVEWPADLQRRAAAEMRGLPPNAATTQLIARAVQQRNINRKCQPSRRR